MSGRSRWLPAICVHGSRAGRRRGEYAVQNLILLLAGKHRQRVPVELVEGDAPCLEFMPLGVACHFEHGCCDGFLIHFAFGAAPLVALGRRDVGVGLCRHVGGRCRNQCRQRYCGDSGVHCYDWFMVLILWILCCVNQRVGTTGFIEPSGLNSMRSMHTSRCQPGPLSRSM